MSTKSLLLKASALCQYVRLVPALHSVLVVDDEEPLAESVVDFLKSRNIQSEYATSLEDARKLLSQNAYRVLVSDVRLSQDGREGLQLLEEAKSKGVFTILITGYADFEVAKRALNSGASYLLEKPLVMDELGELILRTQKQKGSLTEILENYLGNAKLTQREKEIFRLLFKGLTSKEIANSLGNSEKTTKAHITAIFRKCGVASRSELFSAVFPT